MLVYLLLILLFGLVFAVVAALVAVPIALGFRRIFREMSAETVSLLAAGVVPAFLMLVVAASVLFDDRFGGPAAQGLLILAGISFVATMVGWPLGYRFSRRILLRRRG
jgi:hypothetical protein